MLHVHFLVNDNVDKLGTLRERRGGPITNCHIQTSVSANRVCFILLSAHKSGVGREGNATT